MIHDTLAGMAQLKAPPLRWRIVFALAAAEADDGPAQVSLRDLAELTGVGARNARWVNREAGTLVRDGILDRLRLGGSGSNVYRLRSPDDWPSEAWRADRASGRANIAALAEARAAKRADIFARKPRAQRPVVRALTRALAHQIAAVDQGERAASARAHARTPPPEPTAAHYLSTEELRSSLKEGTKDHVTDEPTALDERGVSLCAAVLAGCRAAGNAGAFLSPSQRARIVHVAAEANGRLPTILEAAAAANGPRSTLVRLETLEALLVRDEPATSRPRSPLDEERRRIRGNLRGAELSGDEELAAEMRERLANLVAHEHTD